MNRTMTVIALAAFVVAGSNRLWAFHSGGAGECEGCHIMHGRERTTAAPSMLKGGDASSTCLSCHQAPEGTVQPNGYYVATSDTDMAGAIPPRQLSPGGDFGWLKKNYRWTSAEGAENESLGERHGHNIVAVDFGYLPDRKNAVAPGGTYSSEWLSCTSCHDPHGRYRRFADGSIKMSDGVVSASGSYADSPDPVGPAAVGSYRLLAGKGYQPQRVVGSEAFQADPPVAVSPVVYNRTESSSDTRVAYGKGMSEWCRNCHLSMHQGGTGGHPAGEDAPLSAGVISTYNAYVASGDLSGSAAASFTSLVPFEIGTSDYHILKAMAVSDGTVRNGPDMAIGRPTIMCLTCHRAHASGWDRMARWNLKSEFLVYAGIYPATDSGAPAYYAHGRSSEEVKKAYYDKPASLMSAYQRSLCNKCHGKD